MDYAAVFDMAISALQAQERDRMGDLISRQAAIDAILAVTGNSSVRELYETLPKRSEGAICSQKSQCVNAASIT